MQATLGGLIASECVQIMHAWAVLDASEGVYAFMRLWGGLIFRNGFREVPPPVGEQHAFPPSRP